jgi:hypothetical protein
MRCPILQEMALRVALTGTLVSLPTGRTHCTLPAIPETARFCHLTRVLAEKNPLWKHIQYKKACSSPIAHGIGQSHFAEGQPPFCRRPDNGQRNPPTTRCSCRILSVNHTTDALLIVAAMGRRGPTP